MAEDESNLILHLLRDIRVKQVRNGQSLARIDARFRSTATQADAIKAGVARVRGAGLPHVAYETTGQRLDRLTERLSGLEGRVEELEKPR